MSLSGAQQASLDAGIGRALGVLREHPDWRSHLVMREAPCTRRAYQLARLQLESDSEVATAPPPPDDVRRDFAEQAGRREPDRDVLWKTAIELQERYHRPTPGPDPPLALHFDRAIGIVGLFDCHTGSTATDYRAMLRHATLIRDTPNLYCVFGGDGVENFIAGRLMHANLDNYPLRMQWDLFVDWLTILKLKLLCVDSGNHELRNLLYTGHDRLAEIARSLNVLYSPDGSRLDIDVAGAQYRVLVRHRYRGHSMWHATHPHKRLFHMGERYDVLMMGHSHQPGVIGFAHSDGWSYGFNAGSYMLEASYGHGKGWLKQHEVYMPGVILHPREKRIEFGLTPEEVAERLR